MTPELAALAAIAFVHFAAVQWSQRALERDIGRKGNVGTREGLDAQLSEGTLRLRRALANHTENIGLFIIAVVLVSLTESNSTLTAIFAWAYVAARVLYLPAYRFAWVPWRSLLYLVGLLSTFVMIIASVV